MFNRFFFGPMPIARVRESIAREPIESPSAPSSPRPVHFSRTSSASPGKPTRSLSNLQEHPGADDARRLVATLRHPVALRTPVVATPPRESPAFSAVHIPTSRLLYEVAARLAALERAQ